ncbi:MAG: ferrous iron transport protein B [Saprospiraceae bacterium]|nr:ferrous iron transport protein B [Saprospiraceae bacterium]
MTPAAASPGTQVKIVALIGNPNSGKSSVFNQLTGMRQKVGNFPGVTVDKKTGLVALGGDTTIQLIDFPGTYSFYPHSDDERIVVQTLTHPGDRNYPNAIIYVADMTKLDKHLLLYTQLMDLGLPLILALNMSDVAEKEGVKVDVERLQAQLGGPVVAISGRTGQGIEQLKQLLADWATNGAPASAASFYRLSPAEMVIAREVQQNIPSLNEYQALLTAHHYNWLSHLSKPERDQVANTVSAQHFQSLNSQVEETMDRYDRFTPLLRQSILSVKENVGALTTRLDAVLTHRVAGLLIFFGIMLLIFQAIYAWAAYPMDAIESAFFFLAEGVREWLPAGWLSGLIADGLLAGLGGIVVFVPQIAILFFLITLLEEVGYMARAVFLFDRIMQVFGLNGRSVVAMISGGACAIPAVMSTRTISNWKERLITILVTPFISCSARIPVYTVLIGFVVPPERIWGVLSLQGLAFMGLYLLGIAAALLAAIVFKWILKSRERSFLLLELPEYRAPLMRNIWLTVWEKSKTFVVEAGKVIIVISIALWALASFGPPGSMAAAEQEARRQSEQYGFDEHQRDNLIAANRLEASFAGQLGRAIEPAIRPLGFDWKIGIALITSFAAREVFVGTMATIYSLGGTDDEATVRDRLSKEKDPITGELVYSPATSASLLIFYVFAMMCMSTLAVVKRETKSWKWPLIQFLFMTGLAYVSSLAVYQWMT